MNILGKIKQIFKSKESSQVQDFLYPGLVSAKQFGAMHSDQRMQAVIITGDTGQLQFYQFMKWCIQYDPDLGVRLAALKRISNFIGHNDLILFLESLDESINKTQLEPYLSMALFRSELITEMELNSRLNGG
jgi:hypothetical protein